MRIAFRAVRAFFEEEDGLMWAQVADDSDIEAEEFEPEFVNFEREVSRKKPLSDWEEDGLNFEYKDQLYSGYGLVAACRFGRERLEIDLAEPFVELDGCDGFDVDLDLDDETHARFREGLARVLDGTRARLTIV